MTFRVQDQTTEPGAESPYRARRRHSPAAYVDRVRIDAYGRLALCLDHRNAATVNSEGISGVKYDIPQVALEWGWDADEFLSQTCHKAGLPPDAWKDATIWRFEAEVFSEP